MCQLCNAIAQGLMQPWIPTLTVPNPPSAVTKDKPDKTDKGAKGRQSGKGAKGAGQSKMNAQAVTVDPEGMGDLKKALDVRIY